MIFYVLSQTKKRRTEVLRLNLFNHHPQNITCQGGVNQNGDNPMTTQGCDCTDKSTHTCKLGRPEHQQCKCGRNHNQCTAPFCTCGGKSLQPLLNPPTN